MFFAFVSAWRRSTVTIITASDFLVEQYSLQCISLGLDFYSGSRALVTPNFYEILSYCGICAVKTTILYCWLLKPVHL